MINKINLNIQYIFILVAIFIKLFIPFWLDLPMVKISMVIIAFLFILKALITDYEIKIKPMILILFLFLLSFYKFDIDILLYTIFLSVIVLNFNEPNNLSDKNATFLLYTMTVLILLWATFSFLNGDQRLLINSQDPNFSGYKILMFFFISDKLDFKIGKIISFILMILIASRNLILAILVFYAIRYIKNRFYFIFSRLENFNIQIILFSILIIILSLGFVFNASITKSKSSASRITSVNDNSNLMRFSNNALLFKKLKEDKKILLWGFRENYKQYFVLKNPLHIFPHNSILSLLSKAGLIYFIVYIILLSLVINRVFKKGNYEYIYSFLFFNTFLHNSLINISLLFFISILYIEKKKNKNGFFEQLIQVNKKYLTYNRKTKI